MIPAVMFKDNIIITAYLKDRLIKGRSAGADWGNITLKDTEVMSFDGKFYRKSESECFDLSEVIAVGATGTRSCVVKNDLCWELCELERELSVRNE